MEHVSNPVDLRKVLLFALPLAVLVLVAGIALSADAALKDPEPPNQYNDYSSAYSVSTLELGTRLEVRREGGGDPDFLKFPFLSMDDYVTITVNQSEPTTTVEYFISDPFKFPIYYFYYTGSPLSPNFTIEFAAVVNGPYYLHTAQGFGSTFINLTIERQAMSPPSIKDSNNKPSDKVVLSDGVARSDDAGLPWDPSDFYYINIQPTVQDNKYVTIELDFPDGTEAQWELYNSQGIQRPSLEYTTDTVRYGNSTMEDYRITEAGDYTIRIWMREGTGQYTLKASILTYPNDGDNSEDEATTTGDNSQHTSDVNLSFDTSDYYEIYLLKGQPLWVEMTPMNGPADVYVFDELGNQKQSGGRKEGLETEHINGWPAEEETFYYIVVDAVYESPSWENPPTVDYTLKVWINYAPNRKSGLDTSFKNYHIDEDTMDTDYNVSAIFEDLDGDALTFDLDMSYNDTLLDIQLLPNNHLRIEPEANESGFKVEVLFNATDPHGLWVNYTANIHVDPVNDAPFIDPEYEAEEITMGEDLVKSGVNVTNMFMDIDDGYSTWTFTATTTDHVDVELDEQWLATLTPLVTDWFGMETFTVTCFDSGDLNVSITLTINVTEINDPPVISRYISPFEINEETDWTIDLEPEGDPFFVDPEGEGLTYYFADNDTITIEIWENTTNDHTMITFTGQKDATGVVSGIQLWAVDEVGAKTLTNMSILVTINQVDDPPVLENILTTATVEEVLDPTSEDGITFAEGVYYSYYDIDSSKFDHVWAWAIDDVAVPPEDVDDAFAYTYKPLATAEKDRTVKVTLTIIYDQDAYNIDPLTGWVAVDWTVTVTNRNMPPEEPTITVPDNKTTFKEGDKITLSADASDLDGDTLTYEWFLDEVNPLGTGKTITLTEVDSGEHKVTVKVTDTSGATSEKDFEFKVEKGGGGDDDSPGFGSALAALAVLAAVALLAVRRRL